jgi:positive regulator of sigma E activity
VVKRCEWDLVAVKFLERFWQGCGHCSGEEGCAHLQAAAHLYDRNPWFRGHRMVLVALIIFILPLLTGILFGWIASSWAADVGVNNPWPAAGGLLVGLLLGAGLARSLIALTGWSRRIVDESPQTENRT